MTCQQFRETIGQRDLGSASVLQSYVFVRVLNQLHADPAQGKGQTDPNHNIVAGCPHETCGARLLRYAEQSPGGKHYCQIATVNWDQVIGC